MTARRSARCGSVSRHAVGCQLTECTVDGDPLLVERIVANLVDNAVLHGLDSEPITIRLRSEGEFAELSLTNTCLPLPAGSEQALLEPFRRGRTDRTGSSGGSGLGLAIVTAAAAGHGWSFRLDLSEPGTFVAILRVPVTAP